ncbi:MAG: amino acid carrier protein [Clostridia bacterium]|nr:amino acid carrier protein [Clostridia bacterium]
MSGIGALFLIFLLGCGWYTGRRLSWFCFVHPVKTVRRLFSRRTVSAETDTADKEQTQTGAGYSPVRALTVALAGTLGVGNITGVAAAIALGGPGALFWMWVSALCTMLIKYAEVVLAVETRESIPVTRCGKTMREYHGGPMRYFAYYRHGGVLTAIFCVLCIAASFVQGNLLQMTAAVSGASTVFGTAVLPTAVVLTLLAAILVTGGRRRIAAFTETMIPLMTLLYTVMCLTVIFRNAQELPQILGTIVSSALTPRAAGGGIAAGYGTAGMLLAMRHGCAKGVFSHEAGCGTSPISHAGAETDDSVRQGILGIAEVFVDTILLCTMTGLVLLLSGFGYGMTGEDYTAAVTAAFGQWFGAAGEMFLGISMVFYAFATLVCWSFYGTECVRTLAKRHQKRWTGLYLFFYILCTLCAAYAGGGVLWSLSDGLTMAMTVLNTTAVAGLLGRVRTP